MRRPLVKLLAMSLTVIASSLVFTSESFAQKTKLDPPVVTCFSSTPASITLQVCGGASGAPAGFSLHWMTVADYTTYGWDDTKICKASFSGNAKDSRYVLAANGCVQIQVGDFLFDNGTSTNCANALLCDTQYVFQTFAHATSKLGKSDVSANVQCATAACPETCYTKSQGFYRTHIGNVLTDPDGSLSLKPAKYTGDETFDGFPEWPADITTAGGLQIGGTFYNLSQLNAILHTTPAGGNQLVSLAHQVIAVEFSVAEYGWAPGSEIQQACLAAAHTLIGSLTIPPIGTGTLSGVDGLIGCLDEGYIQTYHCQ
jgi:hypothetical protein